LHSTDQMATEFRAVFGLRRAVPAAKKPLGCSKSAGVELKMYEKSKQS